MNFTALATMWLGSAASGSFKSYAEAKTEAERIVRELAEGSQAAGFTANQSRDATA